MRVSKCHGVLRDAMTQNRVPIKLLSATNPEYHGQLLTELFGLYEGGVAWRRLRRAFIPQNHQEEPGLYDDRIKRTLYTNHAAPIIDLIAAWLFEEEPVVTGAAEPAANLLANADGEGTPLASFAQQTMLNALVGKTAYVMVNMPARDPDAPLANAYEEEKAGATQPFLVNIDSRSVIDWEADATGKLVWAMIYDVHTPRPDPLKPRKRVHRWTLVDAKTIRRWEWEASEDRPDPADKDDATLTANIEHNMGIMPLQRLSLKPGMWAMNKLRDPAVDLLRKDNDLSWALHKSAHALLVFKRGPNDLEFEGPPVIGTGYGLEVGADGDVSYLEPPGGAFDALRSAKQDAKMDLFRVVHQMAVSGEGNNASKAASGASKSRDWDSLQIIMSAYARLMRDFLTELFEALSSVVGPGSEEEPLRVAGMNAWRRADRTDFADLAVLTVGQQANSPTFAKEVTKVLAESMLREEVTPAKLQEIFDEIDQGDPFAGLLQMGKSMGDDLLNQTGLRGGKTDGETDQVKKDKADSQTSNGGPNA